MRDLRVKRMPLRRGVVRDFATIMAWSVVQRQRRADPDESSFIEISIDSDDLPFQLCSAEEYASASASAATASAPASPPEHPEESVVITEDMPRMRAAWQRAAERTFAAGTHGPVTFPLPPGCDSLPSPSDRNVFISSNFRPTSALPLEHRAFLAAKTAKELMHGSVLPVTSWTEVAAIMPTFVAVHPTTGKLRIIFDARALNRLLKDSKNVVRYDDVRSALQNAMCCTKLDVEGAYRHVRVNAEQQRYLCFEVCGRLYKYTCLPFGVSWSPALFLDAIRPVIDRVRARGVRVIWYMDDFLVVADNVHALDEGGAILIEELLNGDWQPAVDKTFPYAYAAIPFLGLLVHYHDGTKGGVRGQDDVYISVPKSKCDRIIAEVAKMRTRGVAHISDLERICGRLNFARIVAPQLGFLRRGLDAAAAAGRRAFFGVVPVKGRLAEDLAAIAYAARTLHTLSHGISDDDLLSYRWIGRAYSDASAVGWGAILINRNAPVVELPGDLVFDGPTPRGYTVGGRFGDADCALSSGAREVRAVSLAVAALDLKDGHVSWHCDATVAVSTITSWSSRADAVAQALSDLWDILQLRRLVITVEHVFRDASFMPVADWLSRQGWREAQAEWSVDADDVRRIAGALGVRITADLFASARNARAARFCSRWLEPGSLGDAFHTRWDTESDVWWAFPPTSQLERFATHFSAVARRRATAAMVSPMASATHSSSSPQPLSSSSAGRSVSASDPHHQSSSSSSVASSPCLPFSIVLLYPDAPDHPWSAAVKAMVDSHAVRSLQVYARTGGVGSDTGSPSSKPQRQLCPRLRLIDGDGRPAPLGPPWPLRVALLRVGSS